MTLVRSLRSQKSEKTTKLGESLHHSAPSSLVFIIAASMYAVEFAMSKASSMLGDNFNTDHLESPVVRERSEVVAVHHAVLLVVINELAEYPSPWELRGHTGVDAALGVALADEGVIRSCAERNEASRAGERGRGGILGPHWGTRVRRLRWLCLRAV